MLPCLCDYDGVFFVFVVVVVSFFFCQILIYLLIYLFIFAYRLHTFFILKKKGEMSAPTLRHYSPDWYKG